MVITPKEFVDSWVRGADTRFGSQLTRFEFPPEIDLPEPTKAFLREAGLPTEAAPFLSFEKQFLPILDEDWGFDVSMVRIV